jgi:hypothetical protein
MLTGETEGLGEKPVPVQIRPPQILHRLTQEGSRASVVRQSTNHLSYGTVHSKGIVSFKSLGMNLRQFGESSKTFTLWKREQRLSHAVVAGRVPPQTFPYLNLQCLVLEPI